MRGRISSKAPVSSTTSTTPTKGARMVDENSPPIAATAKAAPISGGAASGE
jgi:hypothetical protein